MYTQDFFTHNIPMWTQVLSPLKDRPLEVIEIGSFEGRSTVWLLENILTHPQSHITCVDTFSSKEELREINFTAVKQRFLENTKPYEAKITLIEEPSQSYLKRRVDKVDIIYIDGSHLASDVLTDAVLSHYILNPKGIMIFDDYMWGRFIKTPAHPRTAIDAFLECFANEYNLIASGYQMIIEKQ